MQPVTPISNKSYYCCICTPIFRYPGFEVNHQCVIDTLTMKFGENLEHNFNGEFEVEREYADDFEVELKVRWWF